MVEKMIFQIIIIQKIFIYFFKYLIQKNFPIETNFAVLTYIFKLTSLFFV